MNGFCDSRKLLHSLGIQGDEIAYSPEQATMTRSYRSFYAYQIAEALRGADAGEMRYERCFYSLGGHGNRGLKCFCPKMPPHFVEKDGFCNYFKERGGSRN